MEFRFLHISHLSFQHVRPKTKILLVAPTYGPLGTRLATPPFPLHPYFCWLSATRRPSNVEKRRIQSHKLVFQLARHPVRIRRKRRPRDIETVYRSINRHMRLNRFPDRSYTFRVVQFVSDVRVCRRVILVRVAVLPSFVSRRVFTPNWRKDHHQLLNNGKCWRTSGKTIPSLSPFSLNAKRKPSDCERIRSCRRRHYSVAPVRYHTPDERTQSKLYENRIDNWTFNGTLGRKIVFVHRNSNVPTTTLTGTELLLFI